MGAFLETQNSFASGEVSSAFFARENINGLSKLENMDVLASGALTRRRGLTHVAPVHAGARLIALEVAEDEKILLALSAGHVQIFRNGEFIQDLPTPWGADDLGRVQYAQRFGTIIFVHPDYSPRILKKTDGLFNISEFGFSSNDDMSVNIPFMKFDDADGVRITITSSSLGNNFATFTTSKAFWTPENVDGRLLVAGKQWRVYQYVSPTSVIVNTNGSYTIPGAAVSDWREAAFSTRRGWPVSITFHQDRLVYGGSREWPSGVWMSRVGRHNNFDVGTGLDDEAIFITLLSEQRQQICTIVSSDNLQILTSEGEWAISNKPLTPASVNIKQHTFVGSVTQRYLPPQKIEGSTVFVATTGRDIRELSLDQLGENYNATDLCALAKHLMNEPMDLAYNTATMQLFVVLSDGTMAVLNKNSTLGISAWGRYKTAGEFKSVAVLDDETYVCVVRDGIPAIEKFDANALTDCEQYGFGYTARAMPMLASKHAPKKIRIRKIDSRVMNTKTLFINGLRAVLPNEIYAPGAPGYSGDVSVGQLGTTMDTLQPLWTISSDEQLPATILSITVNGWYLI